LIKLKIVSIVYKILFKPNSLPQL